MTLEDRYGPAIVACWAAWESLRRLGFPAAELFVRIHTTEFKTVVCGVEVCRLGRRFLYDAAPCDAATFTEHWRRFARDLTTHQIDTTDLEAAWKTSEPYLCGKDLCLALVEKGLIPPRVGLPGTPVWDVPS